MTRMAEFQKISAEQWALDTAGKAPEGAYEALKLPERSTAGSAGYDFSAPFSIELAPGETIRIPTGIRCRIDAGWVLLIMPRSSVGMKFHVTLDNTVGVIDADYYHAKNEGHIMLAMTNHGTKTWSVQGGDRIAQGLFMPFGITVNDDCDTERTGGMGSTGR